MNVVGIDLSTRAIDLVKLAENDNSAEWVRCDLAGPTAWERALAARDAISGSDGSGPRDPKWGTLGGWWDDVYLVAIETPVNDQKRVLRLIQGAVIASLPTRLRQPHSCWDVHPSTWKAGLGLKGKPTEEDIFRMTGRVEPIGADQNARDAYCLAMYARDLNARAVAAALGTDAA